MSCVCEEGSGVEVPTSETFCCCESDVGEESDEGDVATSIACVCVSGKVISLEFGKRGNTDLFLSGLQ